MGPHDENDDFENTYVGKDEVETNLTFFKDITPDDSPFENLKEGDPICPLEDDIGDYFHIEKEKWEIVGPQFDCAPIYDTDKGDEVESGLPFLSGNIYDDISIDTLEKKGHYFPLHEKMIFRRKNPLNIILHPPLCLILLFITSSLPQMIPLPLFK